MKILVTAFEPFGDREINATTKVLDGIRDLSADTKIVKGILPVDHERGPINLLSLLAENSPDAVICLGEAGGINWIQLERVAINWMDFRIPDNSGKVICDKKINEDGEPAYFSSLPLRLFERMLTEAAIPVKISMTAGTFLCNQIFYVLMEYLAKTGEIIPAGFIHLPAEMVGEEKVDRGCPLGVAIKGINKIIEALNFQ